MTCNSLFFSCLIDQAIQYLLAPVLRFFICLFAGFFFLFFSFHLGMFFAGPKFKLSRDDCVFMLSQSCQMTMVCNFPLRGTASFYNLLQVLQLFSFLRLESVDDRLLTVPDPDLEIRRWGRGRGGLQKTFFRPFGLHFGLQIRRGGPPGPFPWICHCLNIQMTIQLITEHLEALSIFLTF